MTIDGYVFELVMREIKTFKTSKVLINGNNPDPYKMFTPEFILELERIISNVN